MPKFVTQKAFIFLNVILFLIEVVLIYFMVKTALSTDLLTPANIGLWEYVRLIIFN